MNSKKHAKQNVSTRASWFKVISKMNKMILLNTRRDGGRIIEL